MSQMTTDAAIIDNVLSTAGVSDETPDKPVFRPGSIATNTEQIDDPDEVRARLDDFHALTGWVQTTSDVKPFDELGDAQGHVLCAEFAAASNSLHVRQDGRGGWIVTAMETTDGPDLVTDKEFFARNPYGILHYHVGWRREETADGFEQWRPYAARLIHRPQGE